MFVDGDMITNGSSAIEVDSGVNVIIYITGNVNLTGDGLVNDSQVASHVLINGIQPPANPDGTLPDSLDYGLDGPGLRGRDLRAESRSGSQHDRGRGGGRPALAAKPTPPKGTKKSPPKPPPPPPGGPKHAPPAPPTPGQEDDHNAGYNGIYGAFVGKTITVEAMTHVHYDQTLQQAGPVNHYEIVNWTEDNSESRLAWRSGAVLVAGAGELRSRFTAGGDIDDLEGHALSCAIHCLWLWGVASPTHKWDTTKRVPPGHACCAGAVTFTVCRMSSEAAAI